MTNHEVVPDIAKSVLVPTAENLRWRFMFNVLNIPFLTPCDVDIDREEVVKAEQILRDGGGLVIPITHYDTLTSLQMFMRPILVSEEIRQRPFLAPIAKHQYDARPKIVSWCERLGVKLKPVYTPHTIRLAKAALAQEMHCSPEEIDRINHPKIKALRQQISASLRAYSDDAVEYLTHGGIVGIAPQAERLPALKQVGHGPLELLIHRLKKKYPDFRKIAFLLMPMSLYGQIDYQKAVGLNLFRKMDIRVHPTLTLDELEDLAKACHLTLDDYVLSFMAGHVDPNYNHIPQDQIWNTVYHYSLRVT